MAYKRKRSYTPRPYRRSASPYKKRKFVRYAKKAGSIGLRYGLPVAGALGGLGLTYLGMPYAGAALGTISSGAASAFGNASPQSQSMPSHMMSVPQGVPVYGAGVYSDEDYLDNAKFQAMKESFQHNSPPKATPKPRNIRQPTGPTTRISRAAKAASAHTARISGKGDYRIYRSLKNSLRGRGDYRSVKSNVFLGGQTPTMRNSIKPGGGTVISFKEYIGDVVSSPTANTFDLKAYYINPTESSTFPWLSQLASNYQEWEAQGIVFHFKSMSGDALNSVNTSLGQVIMATNYDPTQPDFSSKPEMENTEFSQSVRPSADCLHMIECAKSANVLSNLYTTDPIVGSRFSNLGKFEIATNGCQGTSVNLGELWVTYQIELLKPKLSDTLGEDISFALMQGLASNTFPAGIVGSLTINGSSTMQVREPDGNKIFFPDSSIPKTYQVVLGWNGGGATITQPAFSLVGCSIVQDIYRASGGTPSNNIYVPSSGVLSSRMAFSANINVPSGEGAYMNFAAGIIPNTASVTILISEMPNSLENSSEILPFI